MNSNKKYITQMPKNYIEYIIALNIITHLNKSQEKILIFNPELNRKQNFYQLSEKIQIYLINIILVIMNLLNSFIQEKIKLEILIS